MPNLINKSDTWVYFSQSYLQIARLACQEILGQKYKRLGFQEFELKYKAYDLFIPTIYNIKHGIEIFIKSLKLILAEKLNKNDLKHNIDELFELLKAEVQKHKIIEIIRKKHEEGSEDIDFEFAYNNKLKIPKYLDDLERLIKKYYQCDILKNKLSSNTFTIEDLDNTAFRYPDNNLKINVDYEEVASQISNEDIEKMQQDIDKLLKNFNELGYILEVYKKHAK